MARIKCTKLESGAMQFVVPGVPVNEGTLVFNPALASEECNEYAKFHGYKQRIGDSAALEADEKSGKTDPREKVRRMRRTIEHLESGGSWRMDSAGTGRNEVISAVQRLRNIATYEMTETSIVTWGEANGKNRDEALAHFAASPKVQEMILTMKRERFAQSAVDADETLDEI